MFGANHLKPAIIAEHPEYIVVRDEKIPCASKENIVLKPAGIAIIAKHYFQKYGILIVVCPVFLKIDELAQKIKDYLLFAAKTYPSAHQIGFIFISHDDPDDIFGHALPIFWEKVQTEQHLFFLDTTQYLGETRAEQIKSGVHAFRQQLLSSIPNLKLWSIFGRRQIDYSSCYTDALVILKDSLLAPSFKALAERKIKETQSDVTIFYAPEIVLRTAQVASYLEKSHADFTQLIHCYRAQSKKPQEILADFRARFDEPMEVNGVTKKFGTFTLFKAQEYAVDIERQKVAESLVSSVLRIINST